MRRPDASYSLELSISCVLTILALLPRFGKPDHDEFRPLARNLAVYAFRRGPRTRVAGWPIQPSAALVGAGEDPVLPDASTAAMLGTHSRPSWRKRVNTPKSSI
jgi:hypothetical protein